jgi:UDP-3-O-[3-hydroxymyristoyl] glucosamine N-acyltransferase
MKLSELAEATQCTIEQGDPGLNITSAAGLDIAQSGEITFLANPKYTPQIKETQASAIFLTEGVQIDRSDIAVLRTKAA